MLSRRVFQQLTDSVLLCSSYRPAASSCVAARCTCCCARSRTNTISVRPSSSSSTRWKSRQGNDFFAKEARVQGLKSRAAFKLLELNEKHKLFKPGQTVIDLGFAPGSWSQVAVNRTSPEGRVIGIDMIPAQPPRGVSTIQGDFLSPAIQGEVRAYVRDPELGRQRTQTISTQSDGVTEKELDVMERGYIDMERQAHLGGAETAPEETNEQAADTKLTRKERDVQQGRSVDVVLSDMSEPWDQVAGFYKKSLSDPYFRMMNTSGNGFRDHAGSMDLCMAALTFSFDTLKTGGHFLCKFYQGDEEKAFETKLKRMFAKVHREKPGSSRSESREAYFVALRRKEAPTREEVFR
ncbi:FtsJ-domain-containing protein [Dothidotthia symphoricarpi CBS 119687]|uniref:rRNA methyltransferase 2, mitochondrial n=1 Tax=Dothidotthia symphoricarpi CBS 119687 TaxID=1392245 RepID=A0A6A6AUA9_9PLEO|nr:FtsJ-domain-containing protein [Dothidotthia symphoricarpi CBS 119687]KAF2134534.1 FtsJ-domain-containing protein [Dothidotthia symphoricarpi CBS 119687]